MRLYGGVRVLNRASPENVGRLDFNALPLILKMSARGLQVDLAHFAKLDIALTQDMDRCTEEVHTMTGQYINLGSGDQVADLLFKKLGIKQIRPKMTSSGSRESVEDEVLTAIQHEHPVVAICQNYKEYEKLRGTYVRPMPKLARRTKFGVWRMYPNFKTTRVPSGRLSCSDPNLLAMPTRTERGKDIRRGFITDPGWCFVSVDLSQIEMRMGAHLSEDPNLIKIYQNQEDIYSDFAITAFRLKDDRYKDEGGKWKYPHVQAMEHRYPAKTCILASMYRVTANGLLAQMPVVCKNCLLPVAKHTCRKFVSLWTEARCQDLINSFYMRYSGLTRLQIQQDTFVRRYAYINDMWGRILHTAAARSVHEWVVGAALREAGNFPLQSSSQGILKLAMAAINDDMEAWGTEDIQILLQIHDELLFECHESLAEDLKAHVIQRFETACPLKVPLKASGVSSSESWGSLDKG